MKRKGWYGLILLAMLIGLLAPAAVWARHPTPVLPAGRYATWLGRTEVILELAAGGRYEILLAGSKYLEGRYATVGNEVQFSETQGPGAHISKVDSIARYGWTYDLTGLRFFVISEDCPNRQMVMTAGIWTRLP